MVSTFESRFSPLSGIARTPLCWLGCASACSSPAHIQCKNNNNMSITTIIMYNNSSLTRFSCAMFWVSASRDAALTIRYEVRSSSSYFLVYLTNTLTFFLIFGQVSPDISSDFVEQSFLTVLVKVVGLISFLLQQMVENWQVTIIYTVHVCMYACMYE